MSSLGDILEGLERGKIKRWNVPKNFRGMLIETFDRSNRYANHSHRKLAEKYFMNEISITYGSALSYYKSAKNSRKDVQKFKYSMKKAGEEINAAKQFFEGYLAIKRGGVEERVWAYGEMIERLRVNIGVRKKFDRETAAKIISIRSEIDARIKNDDFGEVQALEVELEMVRKKKDRTD